MQFWDWEEKDVGMWFAVHKHRDGRKRTNIKRRNKKKEEQKKEEQKKEGSQESKDFKSRRISKRQRKLYNSVGIGSCIWLQNQVKVYPPPTTTSSPVKYDDASLAKKTYTPFNSYVAHKRPAGIMENHTSRHCCGCTSNMSVAM